jgi:hypothetical protein
MDRHMTQQHDASQIIWETLSLLCVCVCVFELLILGGNPEYLSLKSFCFILTYEKFKGGIFQVKSSIVCSGFSSFSLRFLWS